MHYSLWYGLRSNTRKPTIRINGSFRCMLPTGKLKKVRYACSKKRYVEVRSDALLYLYKIKFHFLKRIILFRVSFNYVALFFVHFTVFLLFLSCYRNHPFTVWRSTFLNVIIRSSIPTVTLTWLNVPIKVKYTQVYCCKAQEKSSWLGFSKIRVRIFFTLINFLIFICS